MQRMRLLAKRGGQLLLGGLLLLGAVVSWNCWRFASRQLPQTPIAQLELDASLVLDRLQGAIRIPTLSLPLSQLSEDSALHAFRDYLEISFPSLHAPPFICRSGRDFGDPLIPSLLLEWPGESPEMGAILLMSHFDVVPVEASTLEQWSQRPFGGQIDETYVWGRGTLDCKHGVMAILEAITLLHTAGFQPQRTIYVALGHDEELGGSEGNRKIAEWMRSRGLRLQMIVDEGGCIFTEFPGLDRPAALVGVAEKGYMTVKLSVDMEPSELGHASMPPRETAVSILATAVRRVQAHPFPARLDGPLREMLKFLGPEMPSLASRVAMSNLWLCGPLVKRRLGATPSGNALLRTTVAPTMIDGGVKPNVLPAHASATFNLRLLPGDSVDDALAHLQQAIGDARVQVHSLPPTTAASAVSPVDSPEFGQLQRTIGEVFPDVVVAPFVLVGSTDTVHYSDLCENIFRFIPTRLGERDTQRFHGINERLGRENYLEILRFFHRLLENVAGHR